MLTKDRKDFDPYIAGEGNSSETVISADAVFKGSIKFEGVLKIDGKFQGDIVSKGTLYIGKTGEVKAAIKAKSVIIEGKVNGNIQAENRVELRSSAKLIGDIKASRLVIEEGVMFVGNCDVNPANETVDASFAKDEKEGEKKHEKKRLLDSIKEKNSGSQKEEKAE